MKKFISYAVLFLALPFVLGAVWTVFVVVADYRSYTNALVAPPGTTVAVCGDSQTKDALDPDLVPGLFNFSTAATTCDQDFLRLADLLAANRGRFKYVLLDVSPLKIGYSTEKPVSSLHAARVHALLHFYHLTANRRDIGSLGALWRDVVCTRKFNEFRKSILRRRPWRSSMAGAFDPDTEKGFLNPKYRAKALADVKEKAARVNNRPPASPAIPLFGLLAESVGLVRAAGATPVVTTMPLSPPLRGEMDPARLAAFRAAVQTAAKRLGVAWMDYLGLDLADGLWHDGNHLNRVGAEVFSERFARDLQGVNRRLQGQVCIASRGKVKKLCMEVKVDDSADVYIRALRGSGGSGPTDGGWCNAPGQRRILARASGERNRVRAALCISSTRFPVAMRRMMARLPEESRIRASPARRRTAPLCRAQARAFAWLRSPDAACTSCA